MPGITLSCRFSEAQENTCKACAFVPFFVPDESFVSAPSPHAFGQVQIVRVPASAGASFRGQAASSRPSPSLPKEDKPIVQTAPATLRVLPMAFVNTGLRRLDSSPCEKYEMGGKMGNLSSNLRLVLDGHQSLTARR